MNTATAQQTGAPPLTEQPKLPAQRATLNSGAMVKAIGPQSIEEVCRVAKFIAAAGWAPKTYLIDPKNPALGFDEAKITVGIMHGLEVGLTPVAALQSIAVINGTPSIFGDGMLALVQSSGLLENYEEHPVLNAEGKHYGYRVAAKRRGASTPFEASFTMAEATAAGLTKKFGPWQDYPMRMVLWRARSWALRAGFADVLRGLHSAEEVLDLVDVNPPPAKAPPKTAESALDRFAAAPKTAPVTVDQPAGDATIATPEPAAAVEPPDAPGEDIPPPDDLPLMPDEIAADWEKGKWGTGVTWILNSLSTLNEEQRTVLVDSYADMIATAKADKKHGANVVKRFADAGVTL